MLQEEQKVQRAQSWRLSHGGTEHLVLKSVDSRGSFDSLTNQVWEFSTKENKPVWHVKLRKCIKRFNIREHV